MKKMWTAAALAGLCLLTSCGEKNLSYVVQSDQALKSEGMNYNADGAYDDAYEESYEEPAEMETYRDDAVEAEPLSFQQSAVRAINKQMLVYSCDMSIDVLEFDEAVDKLHDLIGKYDGFTESETYSDGGNTSKWQYTDAQKWKTLSTVIRIPSASYDDFCSDAEHVGDMRKKNASVQNLNTEYSDLKTTLSIYEAKEKRYIDLLSEMKSESDAIAVENTLTDIQVEIARIKTRMNNIENDVAYSYINLTLNEVREYTEEPVIEKTDTFGQRLMNTLSRTWHGFLGFLEDMLFLIIRLLPYLLLIGIVLFPLNQLRKAIKKKRASRGADLHLKKAKQEKKADTADAVQADSADVQEEHSEKE